MISKNTITTITATSLLLAAGAAQASEWQLDPAHTDVTFSVTHLAISEVTGKFKTVSGTMNLDPDNLKDSSVDVTIDVASINTGVDKRDGHLKSPDFFNVEKFPTLTFKSTKVRKAGKGKLKVTGDLTMHGVTKSVTLDVDGPSPAVKNPFSGEAHRAFTATGKLDRREFGLEWNKALESGGVVVGNEIQITISAEFINKADAA